MSQTDARGLLQVTRWDCISIHHSYVQLLLLLLLLVVVVVTAALLFYHCYFVLLPLLLVLLLQLLLLLCTTQHSSRSSYTAPQYWPASGRPTTRHSPIFIAQVAGHCRPFSLMLDQVCCRSLLVVSDTAGALPATIQFVHLTQT